MDNLVLVLVVNYNRETDTIACIESLLCQDYENIRVAILDNHSDSIDSLIQKYKANSKITIIQNQENEGFAKGNNKALSILSKKFPEFKYLALINNDAVAQKDWISQLVSCAIRTSSDQISSCILNFNMPDLLDNIGHQFLNTGEIVPIAYNKLAADYTTERETFGACAAGSLYSLRMIKQIGLFDPFFDTGYEDAELGVRSVICGYKSIYCPSAKVFHKISQSVSEIDDREYRLRQQINIYYSYFKLMPTGVILLNGPFILIKYLLVLLVELVSFKWSYISLHFDTIRGVYQIRNRIKNERHKFFKEQRLITSFQILKRQVFFLTYDIKRMFSFLFRGQKSVFDTSIENTKNS